MYLLDDVLSAVDSQVGCWILQRALLGPLLNKKTRIMCTHNVQVSNLSYNANFAEPTDHFKSPMIFFFRKVHAAFNAAKTNTCYLTQQEHATCHLTQQFD